MQNGNYYLKMKVHGTGESKMAFQIRNTPKYEIPSGWTVQVQEISHLN